jgi:GNAT superfamily N-acetyltransferase
VDKNSELGAVGRAGALATRPVSTDDLDLVCRHREQMFRESNAPGRTEEILKTQTAHFRPWLATHLGDGSYFGYIVEDDGKPIAGIGLMIIEWPPGPSHPMQDKRGYVLNVFVEPSHRKQGIAKELMDRADREFAKRGVAFVVLHATKMGRLLYEQLGWSATSEMAKSLSQGDQK